MECRNDVDAISLLCCYSVGSGKPCYKVTAINVLSKCRLNGLKCILNILSLVEGCKLVLMLHKVMISLILYPSPSQQMVMSLRVSELQVLLGYAGRNKHGRKHELLTKALHLLKTGCSPDVHMKIKELYRRRFPAKMVSPSELLMPGPHHPATVGMVGGGGAALPTGLTQLTYEGHGGAPSPAALLPLSLLGPGKHELTGLTHHLSTSATLHPVHPDVKLQRLPFYDMLDELIKPTSLGEEGVSVCFLRELECNSGQLSNIRTPRY